jgi:hypothetical protein
MAVHRGRGSVEHSPSPSRSSRRAAAWCTAMLASGPLGAGLCRSSGESARRWRRGASRGGGWQRCVRRATVGAGARRRIRRAAHRALRRVRADCSAMSSFSAPPPLRRRRDRARCTDAAAAPLGIRIAHPDTTCGSCHDTARHAACARAHEPRRRDWQARSAASKACASLSTG